MKTNVSAERFIGAPADVIYHCLADYTNHHRPEGFLPPAFTGFVIERGGLGAGTELHQVVEAGGRRRTMTALVSEPQPGHTLVETGSGIETTFTVEPSDGGARVRFDTLIEAGGLEGVLNRAFAARLLLPIYTDELRRLEVYAETHGPVSAESSR